MVRKMPEKRKEPRTCHDCGLEDLDSCEDQKPKKHLPDNENLAPCVYCVRNPKKCEELFVADFYCEMWTRSGDKEYTPIIEDPDPDEQELLRVLHLIINEAQPVIFRVVQTIFEKKGGD